MILYLDTSSLLKIYLDEDDCEAVGAWTREVDAVATSRVSLPEAAAALMRRRLHGDLSSREFDDILTLVRRDWAAYLRVDVDEVRAADVAIRRRLRGFDAVQLAAALALNDAVGSNEVAFTSFDAALNRAAGREGLLVLEP